MKILHILSQIPEATGSGIYLQSSLQHASRRGFKNYLLAGIPADFPKHKKIQKLLCSDYNAVYFELDLPFPVVGMSDVMPYPSTRFCDLSDTDLSLYQEHFKRKLVESVERWKPDLIHSHHLWLLTSLTRQLFPEIPLVTSCHGSDLRQFQNCPHLQPAVLNGCRNIDAICALNQGQKLEIQHLYGIVAERIQVVGAGYDSARFYLPEQPLNQKPIQILYAGKLSRAKGVLWLLKALNRLPADEFVFHLVGDSDGIEKQEILNLTGELDNNIQVHGKIKQEQLADLMRQTDIFVLPSFYEGLPLVLLEALACGCRIVATALPGIVELFSGIKSNWIQLAELPRMATIDEPEACENEKFIATLARALQTQIEQTRKRHQPTGVPDEIRNLLNNHTWEAVFLKIEKIYNRLGVK
ncbi:MAG: glycosyltransferase family 4 protein [Desulfuromusa sp.]|jgi:glycosyltransferase involved in cell wall biosynthesis|nr:glycosyltransferase family 4 protein [Desulfuromusa sp.]